MTQLHQIGELDRTGIVLSLTPSERRVLARAADRVGVDWQVDGSARIYSRGYVGSIALSSDTIVSVTPKVPIVNILALASLAYRTLPIPAAVGGALLDSKEPVVDWLAVLLVTEIQALLANGLRQGYVVVQDELPYVRGRLRFDAPLWGRPGLTPCEFADFLPDIPENRLLRATLEILATRRLLPGLRIRVEQLLRTFQGVAFARPTMALVGSCRITRLNQHYRPAVELCRVFLEQSGVGLDVGRVAAPAYFFPMELVFQEAVTNLLRSRLAKVSRQSGRSYQSVTGIPARSLTFAADIVVGSPPQLVIDTKYAPPEMRNQYGGWSFHNQHVYQAAFYALSLGCPALLVYPKVDRDISVTFDIEGISVCILTVDLRQPGLPDLQSLVQAVSALARVPKVA
jgi:5-methylcytosine-specific restriction enzyme subunit McrC